MNSRYAERQITSVQQYRGEHLIDYLDYFDSLLKRYPDHGLHKYDILDSFLRGMDPSWYERLQRAAGDRWLGDLGPREVWDLIDDVAGIVWISDHQQDQGNEENPVSIDEFNALARKVEEQGETMKEILKQMTQIAAALREEQDEQDIGDETKATTDHESLAPEVTQEPDVLPLIVDPLPVFPLQASRLYDRADLVLLSDVGTRVSNHGPILENVSIRSEPHKKRSWGTYKDVPEKLDWERTEVMLPYKRCQRKRYVAIKKYDHTYPWEPGW